MNRSKTITFLAFAYLAIVIMAGLFAPMFTSMDPVGVDLDSSRLAPCLAHPFGTDMEGRDIFARVVYGARVTILIGFGATTLAMLIGLAVGTVAGFYGGSFADKVLSALIDIDLAFPSLLLAIAVSVVLPPGIWSVFIALALAGWGTFARLIRSLVLSLKQADYVTLSTAMGCSDTHIVVRHIIPGCLSSLIVAGGLKIGTFILGEAGLSFLGIGVLPPAPTWGGMVSLGRAFLSDAPWMSFFPGLAIALTVLSVNIAGDYLKEKSLTRPGGTVLDNA